MALELRGNKLTTGREANRVVELLVKLTEFEFKKENTLVWSDNDWSTRASLSGRGLLERIDLGWKIRISSRVLPMCPSEYTFLCLSVTILSLHGVNVTTVLHKI